MGKVVVDRIDLGQFHQSEHGACDSCGEVQHTFLIEGPPKEIGSPDRLHGSGLRTYRMEWEFLIGLHICRDCLSEPVGEMEMEFLSEVDPESLTPAERADQEAADRGCREYHEWVDYRAEQGLGPH